MEEHLAKIRRMLAKKATFEEGVKLLTSIIKNEITCASSDEKSKVFEVVSRVGTLLQTRYTREESWRLGLSLFETLQKADLKPVEAKHLTGFVDRAKAILGEGSQSMDNEEDEMPEFSREAGRGPFLFEGQMSSGTPPPRPSWLIAQTAHFSLLNQLQHEDLTPPATNDQHPEQIIHNLEGTTMLEQLGQVARNPDTQAANNEREFERSEQAQSSSAEIAAHPSTTAEIEELNGVGPGLSHSSGPEVAAEEEVEQDLNVRQRIARRRLFALLVAMDTPSVDQSPEGPHPNAPNFLQVMRAAMHDAQDEEIPGLEEALLATLQDAPKGAPPASVQEVAKLPKLEVTLNMLRSLEDDAKCTICQEQFAEKEILLQMPCQHLFHPDCIKPWLEVHNSCPLCRFEMLTDDEEYERKKEADRIEKEEQRGIDNALNLGEHMFM